MKFIVFFLLTFSPAVFSTGTASTFQASYWMSLVELFTRLAFLSMALASLCLLVWICIRIWKTVNNSGSLNPAQDPDFKPMTFPMVLGGLIMCVTLYLPHKTINLMGDILGLSRADAGMSVCFVTNVSVAHLKWTNNASSCIEHLKKKAQEFAQYTESDHLESANLPLVFGVGQLLGLIFFASSAWVLGKHFVGVRNLKVTAGMALIAMAASSAIIMLPNFVDYVSDLRDSGKSIITPP